MSTPRIEVDLNKIRDNTRTVVERLKARGISVTGVTKAVCGLPAIARAILDGGAVGLADARIDNVRKLRDAGVRCPITLIRTPMLSQVDQVVQSCEASYNTEIAVIAALAAAAIRQGTVHDIILIVEMGDLREGILPENLGAIAQHVVQMPGVVLKGIGANFACLSGTAPTAAKMSELCDLANETEGRCGPFIETVSGGNSANLPWAWSDPSISRINDLRLGEAILLGMDPVSGHPFDGLHTDAFTLIAEVIEMKTKPVPSHDGFVDEELIRLRLVSNDDYVARVILAIGQQDTDISGLSLPLGCTLIGATSDHLVIRTHQNTPQVGSEMRFQMNYSALMQAMAAPDIETKLLPDRATIPVLPPRANAQHLALV